jgi:hypothetical protein
LNLVAVTCMAAPVSNLPWKWQLLLIGHTFPVPSPDWQRSCERDIYKSLYVKHTKLNTHVRTDKGLTTTVHDWTKNRPDLSERASHNKGETPLLFEYKFREWERKLVAGPRWWPDTRPNWPTDRRS